jgi:hypothetical protein
MDYTRNFDEETVQLCMDWLKNQVLIKTFTYNSYHLKHVVERYYHVYIQEGSFVEAVERMNIPYEIVNVYKDNRISINIPISKKTKKLFDTQEIERKLEYKRRFN